MRRTLRILIVVVVVVVLALLYYAYSSSLRPSASSIESQLLREAKKSAPDRPILNIFGNPMYVCGGPNGPPSNGPGSECMTGSPSFVTCHMPSSWVPGNQFTCGVFDTVGNQIGTWTVNELPKDSWNATYQAN